MKSLILASLLSTARAAVFRESQLPALGPSAPSQYDSTVSHDIKRDGKTVIDYQPMSATRANEVPDGEHPQLHPSVDPPVEHGEHAEHGHEGHEAHHGEEHEAHHGEAHEHGAHGEHGEHGEHEGHGHGHEGHEHHHESSPEAFGLSVFLMGGVAALMMVFYLVNNPHPKVKGATWKVLNMTTSIFVAVLIYGSGKSAILEILEPEPHVQVAIILILFVLCFCGAKYVLFRIKMMKEEEKEKEGEMSAEDFGKAKLLGEGSTGSVAVVSGHITGFAAMYGFADAMELPFIEEMGGAGILLTIAVAAICIIILMVVGDKVLNKIALADGTVDEDEERWMDLCKETDDDVFCLAISFLFNIYIRYLIRGKIKPYEPGHVGNVTQMDATALYLVSCGFAALVLVGTLVHLLVHKNMKERFLSMPPRADGTQPSFKEELPITHRFLDVMQHCNFMGCAWCFLFWGEWQLYVLGWESTIIGGCLVVAVCLTLSSFAAVLIIYYFMVDLVPAGYGIRRALQSFELALGILVGFSWERAFDVGFEEMEIHFESHEQLKASSRTLFYSLNLFLFIVVAPAWRMYIYPTAMKFSEEGANNKESSETKLSK